jgi:hypothetical protein
MVKDSGPYMSVNLDMAEATKLVDDEVFRVLYMLNPDNQNARIENGHLQDRKHEKRQKRFP